MRNNKTSINSHTQVKAPEYFDHNVRPNNFGILPVDLGLVDVVKVFEKYVQHQKTSNMIY